MPNRNIKFVKCEICGQLLRDGKWYEGLVNWFRPGYYKEPKILFITNPQSGNCNVTFVCKEDREWIREHPAEAEAVLRSKLF